MRIAAVVLGLVAATGIIEIVSRLTLPEQPPGILLTPLAGNVNVTEDMFVESPGWFWDLRPNVRRVPDRWGDVTNSMGLRESSEIEPEESVILCVGDSCTYGFGLPQAASWPAVLNSLEPVRVVNAGVPGFSSWQGIKRFDEKLRRLRISALVVQFGNNDAVPWPSLSVAGTDRVTDALTDSERAYNVRALEVAHWSRALGVIYGSLAPRPDPTQFSARDFGSARVRVPIAEFRANLKRFAECGIPTVFVVWPRRRQLDADFPDPMPDALVREYLSVVTEMNGDQVRVVDLREAIGTRTEDIDSFFIDEVHASEEGSKIVAREVAQALASLGGPKAH